MMKKVIFVYSACLYSQPMRRICKRLEEFKEVNLDFSEVDFMGQGFADVRCYPDGLSCFTWKYA